MRCVVLASLAWGGFCGPFAASTTSEGGVVDVDRDSWASIVGAAPAAVVMFYAPWCQHCKRFAPEYAAAAAETAASGVAFTRCDAVEHEDLARAPRPRAARADDARGLPPRAQADEYEVSGYPKFLLFKRGARAATFRGRPDRGALSAWVRGEAPAFSVVDL